MSEITRRNMLAGIAGCSLAAVLGCKKGSNKADRIEKARALAAKAAKVEQLNVLIHGLSVLYVNDGTGSGGASKGINLYMPLIQNSPNPTPPPPADDHRYLFGNLDENSADPTDELKPISPKGICTLSGVTPGPRPNESLFKADLLFPGASVNSPDTMRQFVLPWTTNIQSVTLMQGKQKEPLFTDTRLTPPNNYNNLPQISTICILTYAVSGQPQITYDDGTDTGWSLQPSTADPKYANLHIYAEPKKTDAGHAKAAFEKLMQTINIDPKQLSFNQPPSGVVTLPDNPTPLGLACTPGIQCDDLSCLEMLLSKGGELANCVRAVIIQ